MTLILHENADEHAPFKHYIIPYEFKKIIKDIRKKVKEVQVTETGFYVVCYFCRHWVNRPLVHCRCPATCHSETIDNGLALSPGQRVGWFYRNRSTGGHSNDNPSSDQDGQASRAAEGPEAARVGLHRT